MSRPVSSRQATKTNLLEIAAALGMPANEHETSQLLSARLVEFGSRLRCDHEAAVLLAGDLQKAALLTARALQADLRQRDDFEVGLALKMVDELVVILGGAS